MLRRALVVVVFSSTVWAVAAASASRLETVVFDVTVNGSQRTVVTGVRTSVDDLGCTVRQTDRDRQTLAFTTRDPGRLVAVRGTSSSTRVAVTVEATGTRRRTRAVSGAAPECDVAPETTETRCASSRFSARVVATLPSFGTVRVSGSPLRRRDSSRCTPRLVRPRPFLVPAAGRFPATLLTDRRAARIILRGDARFTDTLESGARRVTTVQWTATLRRAD